MTSTEITVSSNISPWAPGSPATLVKMRNRVSYLVYMCTLGAGRMLIKSIIIVWVFFNLMAWKASWAHRTGENEKKKIMIKWKSRSKRPAPVIYTVDKYEWRYERCISKLSHEIYVERLQTVSVNVNDAHDARWMDVLEKLQGLPGFLMGLL